MPAYHEGLECVTLRANTDLRTHQHKIIELSSTYNECGFAQAGQGYGVLLNKPNSGEAATVVIDGRVRVHAGGTLSVGQYVTAANSGWAVAIGSAATTVNKVLGRVVANAASGFIAVVDIDKTLIIGSGQTI